MGGGDNHPTGSERRLEGVLSQIGLRRSQKITGGLGRGRRIAGVSRSWTGRARGAGERRHLPVHALRLPAAIPVRSATASLVRPRR